MSAVDDLKDLFERVGRPPPGMQEKEEGPTNEAEFRTTVRAIAKTLPDDQITHLIRTFDAPSDREKSELQKAMLYDLRAELQARQHPGPSPSPSPR